MQPPLFFSFFADHTNFDLPFIFFGLLPIDFFNIIEPVYFVYVQCNALLDLWHDCYIHLIGCVFLLWLVFCSTCWREHSQASPDSTVHTNNSVKSYWAHWMWVHTKFSTTFLSTTLILQRAISPSSFLSNLSASVVFRLILYSLKWWDTEGCSLP